MLCTCARLLSAAFVVAIAIGLPATAAAAPITVFFQTLDLPDAGSGDLWRYDYVFAGTVAAHEGIDIFFDAAEYSDLELLSAHVDWDVIVIQPDPVAPDAGFLSAIANLATPSFADVFSVSFIWTGAGNPGSQPFTLSMYDANHVDFIDPAFDAGVTQRLVPEPGALLLMTTALAYGAYRRRWSS
jgi:hypothetical protein